MERIIHCLSTRQWSQRQPRNRKNSELTGIFSESDIEYDTVTQRQIYYLYKSLKAVRSLVHESAATPILPRGTRIQVQEDAIAIKPTFSEVCDTANCGLKDTGRLICSRCIISTLDTHLHSARRICENAADTSLRTGSCDGEIGLLVEKVSFIQVIISRCMRCFDDEQSISATQRQCSSLTAEYPKMAHKEIDEEISIFTYSDDESTISLSTDVLV